jgi:hypothetical protein
MPDDLITQIMKRLKGSPQARADFIQQLINEQDLYNTLKDSGVTTDISDPQARARNQPFGVLSAVQKINLVDLITEITTIKNIDLVAAITNIANLASLDLIDLITRIALIDRITLIDTITSITTIGKIRSAQIEGFSNIVRNPRFDDGTTYWTVTNATVINEGFYTDHSLRLGNDADMAQAYQFLPPFYGLILEGGLWHRSNAADLAIGTVYVSYTDGANTSFVLNGTSNVWNFLNITGLTAAKKAKYILVLINAPYIVDVTNFNIYPNLASEATLAALNAKVTACNTGAVAQITRQNLKAQPEREDLLLKDVDLSASASLQAVLTAIVSQKHKVYAVGYEADADGVYYFSATVSGVTSKFARRITKGVFAQTFMHPVVCDVNTVLNFMSTTGNSKVWLQYKTEA